MIGVRQHQTAYVTRNLEKAVAEFKSHARTRWDAAFPVTFDKITTPAGRGALHCKMALLWVDDMQYELIEPVGGLDGIYRDWLPEHDGLKFHHFCFRVADWEAFRPTLDKGAWPVLLDGEIPGAKFTYVDARASFGHFVEYIWMTDDNWSAMGGL